VKAAILKFATLALIASVVGVPKAVVAQQAVKLTDNANALILAPLYDSFPVDASDIISVDIHDACGATTPFYNGNADVAAFRGMGGSYGVISVVSHGNVAKDSHQVIICTSQSTSVSNGQDLVDSGAHLIREYVDENGSPMGLWSITPEFVSIYGAGGANRFTFMDTCHSADNPTMANAASGAYFGFSGLTYPTDGVNVATALFDTLTTTTDPPDQRTARFAYSDASGAAANFLEAGDANLALFASAVVNGGFENPKENHLVGWNTGFTPGAGPYNLWTCADYPNFYPYAPPFCIPGPDGPNVAATNLEYSSGKWSAQIGKWGTSYVGNGGPDPGIEPAGDEFLYQVVQLGSSDDPGGPQHYSLSFDYKIVSYSDLSNVEGGVDAPYAQVESAGSSVGNSTPLASASLSVANMHQDGDIYTTDWQQASPVDLSSQAPGPVRILFGEHESGFGQETAIYIDNVAITCSP